MFRASAVWATLSIAVASSSWPTVDRRDFHEQLGHRVEPRADVADRRFSLISSAR